jgi:hypothetical protein
MFESLIFEVDTTVLALSIGVSIAAGRVDPAVALRAE